MGLRVVRQPERPDELGAGPLHPAPRVDPVLPLHPLLPGHLDDPVVLQVHHHLVLLQARELDLEHVLRLGLLPIDLPADRRSCLDAGVVSRSADEGALVTGRGGAVEERFGIVLDVVASPAGEVAEGTGRHSFSSFSSDRPTDQRGFFVLLLLEREELEESTFIAGEKGEGWSKECALDSAL